MVSILCFPSAEAPKSRRSTDDPANNFFKSDTHHRVPDNCQFLFADQYISKGKTPPTSRYQEVESSSLVVIRVEGEGTTEHR